jgi:hypothetical protein
LKNLSPVNSLLLKKWRNLPNQKALHEFYLNLKSEVIEEKMDTVPVAR